MRKLRNTTTGILTATTLFFVSANSAFAQCYDFEAEVPPTLGKYLQCVLPDIYAKFQIIMIATALILGMILVLKIAMNRENPDFLAEVPTRVMYLIIFALLIAGAGGFLLNLFLRLFGFGDVQTWLDVINESLEKLNEWGS